MFLITIFLLVVTLIAVSTVIRGNESAAIATATAVPAKEVLLSD
jgi:hypothetical protein